MQDSEVWKTIKGPDGKSFFLEGDCDKEIQLGTTISLDWFGRKTSSYGPSHLSGAMSFTIQNFENVLKYRADHLILCSMPPGPTEPMSEQLQAYLKLIVDDLIMLYDEGIIIKPPEHPDVILTIIATIFLFGHR
ncbi:hypothetical protein DFH07DRAFT_773414 [Mycena maculata]|uniref:Uncharacterized protein n=1 Tax=Mycena maculata TaxID=230809 RepID=A0AAD7NDK5_9AGAR|nr:hypothetical protein DFH07DRAFT_773414 [Mycena maculata]